MTTNYRIRFMANNLAALNKNSLTYSSQTTGFEATNALDEYRSNQWKASGHFEISDGTASYDSAQNDQLYINDGSDKTVTITAGNYTTGELLAAQIQTDLNASSSGWTVSYDGVNGTWKFTISNSGSVTLRLSQTTNSIWSTLGYTSTSDDTGTSFPATEPRAHTSEYIRLDMGWQAPLTFFACIGAVGQTFSLSQQATVTLKGNNIDTNWDSAPFSETLTVTEKGIFAFFDTTPTTAYRYYRFEYEDKYNSTFGSDIPIGSIYMGDYQTVTGRNFTAGFSDNLIDNSTVSESESGVLYFDKRVKYVKLQNVTIPYMETADKEVVKDVFNTTGITTPLYISLDPLTNITTDITDFTKYVVFESSPQFVNNLNCRFSTTLNFREVI